MQFFNGNEYVVYFLSLMGDGFGPNLPMDFYMGFGGFDKKKINSQL